MRYSEAFKAQMVKKMAGPERVSANALSQEVGVAQGTLSRWLREMGNTQPLNGKDRTARRPEDWTTDEKLKALVETEAMDDGEVGVFLRTHGLHQADLQAWR
jgi:transposase